MLNRNIISRQSNVSHNPSYTICQCMSIWKRRSPYFGLKMQPSNAIHFQDFLFRRRRGKKRCEFVIIIIIIKAKRILFRRQIELEFFGGNFQRCVCARVHIYHFTLPIMLTICPLIVEQRTEV